MVAPDRPGWSVVAPHFVPILVVLVVAGWQSPPPSPTDQAMMERVGQRVIIPGCADLNCFRFLVPAVVESFPGPSLPRWRVYVALMNAGAAVATGRLVLALGLAPPVAILATWLSGIGPGSFAMVHHPYNADPLVLLLAPVTTLFLVRGRSLAGGALATAGIFAKEFAAAPPFIVAAAAALRRDWTAFGRGLILAVGVMGVWVGLQLGLMTAFGYGYNDNPSTRLFEGGYFAYWLRHMSAWSAVATLAGAYGALTILVPFGLRLAPRLLRHLAMAAVPAALAFAYVATPDRALWNFYFLVVPLGAVVLGHLRPALGWAFVACYGLASLRTGAQLAAVPSARYAIVVSVALGLAAIVASWSARGRDAAGEGVGAPGGGRFGSAEVAGHGEVVDGKAVSRDGPGG